MGNKNSELPGGLLCQLNRTSNALVGLKDSDPKFFEELFGPENNDELPKE